MRHNYFPSLKVFGQTFYKKFVRVLGVKPLTFLLLLCLSLACAACLPRPGGIEQPTGEETPQGSGSGKVRGNPFVLTDTCMKPSDCERPLPNTGQTENPPNPTDPNNTNNQTNTGNTGNGKPLVAEIPELSDDIGLDTVMLKAECDKCLHPLGNSEVELHCEVTGCSGSVNFVTSTSRPQRNYRRALCGSSGKTVGDLTSLKLVCQFRKKNRWWWDYKKDTEINLSKAIVKAQHLCVVTADSLVRSGDNVVTEESLSPKPKIEQANCNHSSMWNKQHKLSISFSW